MRGGTEPGLSANARNYRRARGVVVVVGGAAGFSRRTKRGGGSAGAQRARLTDAR